MKNFISYLKKQKNVGLLNTFSLSLGIMVAIIVGSWVIEELSFDQFHKNKGRIYRVITNSTYNNLPVRVATTHRPFGKQAKEKLPAIENVCRVFMRSNQDANINNVWHTGIRIFVSDQSFFSFFSFSLKEGIPEQILSAPDRVVISESAATKYFSRQNPIGQIVKYDDRDFVVSGIMKDIPRNSSLQADFIFPLFSWYAIEEWGGDTSCNTFILLQDGKTADELISPLEQIINQALGDSKESDITLSLESLNDLHFDNELMNEFIDRKGSKSLIMIFVFTALIILVISCINFANLFVSTSFVRAKTVGIKKCMGADKNLLIREFYFETACYVLLSIILGLLLATFTLPIFNNFTQSRLDIDFTSLPLYVFLTILFVITVLLAGSFPALYITRFNIIETISGKFKGKQVSFFQKGLTIFQLVTSIALLIVVTFMQKQVNYLTSYDLGFDSGGVVYVEGRSNFENQFESFKIELSKEPTIIDVARKENSMTDRFNMSNVSKIPSNGQQPILMDVYWVSPNYFDLLNIKFIDGECPFGNTSSSNELVINECAVKLLGLDQPVGQTLSISGNHSTVKGVVRNTYVQSLHQDVAPQVYMKLNDHYAWNHVFFKISGNPQRAINFIEQKWKERESGFPFEYHFLDDTYKRLYTSEMNAGRVFTFAMIITIAITVTGMFAIAHYATQRRVREIALRKIHGATVKDIFVLLNKDFLLWVVIAFMIACPVAYYGLYKWLNDFVVRTPLSAWVFLMVGAIALLIALLTTSYQTWKAATKNPINGLKIE